MEAEIGAMNLKANECQSVSRKSLEARREAWNGFSPPAEESNSAKTLILGFQPPEP